MAQNKRPAPKKANPSSEEKDEALTQKLCDLAIELVEQEDSASMSDSLKQKEGEFHKLIKKSLFQKSGCARFE